MQALTQAEGRTERREAVGVRQALLLSSAGHLLALTAFLLLASGVPPDPVPAAVDVVLVAAPRQGQAESAGPGNAMSIGGGREAKRPDRRAAFWPPRNGEQAHSGGTVPPGRPTDLARSEETPFHAGNAWEGGFPAMERPTGAAPAGSADVRSEIGRDRERAGMVEGAVPAAAPPSKDPGGEMAGGGGDGTAAALLRDRIQSRIVYPDEAVRRGLEGEVLLRIRIGKGGRPGEIRVARSSGARILDEAARRGVIRAAPLPSAPGWVEVPVRFLLRRTAEERP